VPVIQEVQILFSLSRISGEDALSFGSWLRNLFFTGISCEEPFSGAFLVDLGFHLRCFLGFEILSDGGVLESVKREERSA
jgi:hypothetical protein